MGIKDHAGYHSTLNQLHEPTAPNLIALGRWVQDEALPWLWHELGGIVLVPQTPNPLATKPPAPRQLIPMRDVDAVRRGLFTSLPDWKKKLADPKFYRAHLTMLDAEARRYCATITRSQPVSDNNPGIPSVHEALRDMMAEAIVMLEDAASNLIDATGYFGVGRRKEDHPFEVFKGAEQIVYGSYSGLTHADRAPSTPIAVLRTAIELRLRHAFGAYSFRVEASDDVAPIELSKLFDAIRTRQNETPFAVDVHDVWRIYRWSNFYLHRGVRDYQWVPGFLLQFLRPIFAAPQGVDGGLSMKRETWRAVREALEHSLQRPSFVARFATAWRILFHSHRKLELPSFSEEAAQCMFLD